MLDQKKKAVEALEEMAYPKYLVLFQAAGTFIWNLDHDLED